MNTEIKLKSRDGTDNRLIQVGPLKYQLVTPFSYRIGYTDDTMQECSFIDPSGGPLISVGSEIEGHRVKAICNGIIEFEDEDKK